MSPQPRTRRHPLRVLGGIGLMAAVVVIAFAILAHFAGNWGVPYFSFTTDRGSTCRNTWTGFTCEQMSIADVNFYADMQLPPETRVDTSRYVSTHDYSLDSTLTVPSAKSAAALAALKKDFGDCVSDHPSPLPSKGLTQLCVMADDLSDADGKDPAKASRIYNVGTGIGADGTRRIALSVRSR